MGTVCTLMASAGKRKIINRTTSVKAGFTLIELLVVIAIISILAAILFPVFISAKEAGKQAACTGNCRQIGKALMLYVQDWDGRWPDPHIYGDLAADCASVCWDIHGIPTLLSKYTKTNKVWLCPSDPKTKVFNPAIATRGLPGIAAGDSLTSYPYRLCLWQFSMYGPLDYKPDNPIPLTDSTFCRPTRQVVFHEAAAWHHGNFPAWQGGGAASGVVGQPQIMAVYADGHAKLWKIRMNPGDDWPYDANWFNAGYEGVFGVPHQDDPSKYWDE